MDPEHALEMEAFHRLPQAAESLRDRLVLLLLGGISPYVSEAIQVRVGSGSGCGLHTCRVSNSKGKNGRTAMLPATAAVELGRYLIN